MRILLTGANGFLGSHLLKYFLYKENEIYAISLHTNRLETMLNDIQFSCCSINGITSLEKRIEAFAPNVVIHCAWYGGRTYSETQNSAQFHKNIPGLADLMEVIKRTYIPHFIGIGTGSEYGDQQNTVTEKIHEKPISLYGTCKFIAKLYTEQFCKIEGIKWTWLRPFYTYGPNDVPTRLIPKTIISCLKKEEVLLNKCNSIVDYLYIDDFVAAVHKLTSLQQEGIFNVCSSKSYIIRDIVEKIGIMTDNEQKLIFGKAPERSEYPSIILGSGEKLKTITGWSPKIDMNEGLNKTIEFYKNI